MSGQLNYYIKYFYINFPFVDENYVKYWEESISDWGRNKNNFKKSRKVFNIMLQISLHFK